MQEHAILLHTCLGHSLIIKHYLKYNMIYDIMHTHLSIRTDVYFLAVVYKLLKISLHLATTELSSDRTEER